MPPIKAVVSLRFPRTRGDRPLIDAVLLAHLGVPPHPRG